MSMRGKYFANQLNNHFYVINQVGLYVIKKITKLISYLDLSVFEGNILTLVERVVSVKAFDRTQGVYNTQLHLKYQSMPTSSCVKSQHT